VKRSDVLRYLISQGCIIGREGARHTIIRNPATGLRSALSRQQEIDNDFVRDICKQLGIDPPGRS
jgi:hypothetical protein